MTPVLYIIARTDISSMNPGKLAAQASHAANAFAHHFHAYTQEYNAKPGSAIQLTSIDGFRKWETETTQGFGTVLVLGAKMVDIYPVVDLFKAMGYVSGIVHDPSYPIVDGEVVHHIPLDTCAYVFVPNRETDEVAVSLLKRFSLHP